MKSKLNSKSNLTKHINLLHRKYVDVFHSNCNTHGLNLTNNLFKGSETYF